MKQELEKYKAIYSEYVQCAVDLHNYHQQLMRRPAWTLGPTLRKHLKKMIVLEKQLIKASFGLCNAKLADYRARQLERGIRIKTLAEKGQELDWENGRVIRNIKK